MLIKLVKVSSTSWFICPLPIVLSYCLLKILWYFKSSSFIRFCSLYKFSSILFFTFLLWLLKFIVWKRLLISKDSQIACSEYEIVENSFCWFESLSGAIYILTNFFAESRWKFPLKRSKAILFFFYIDPPKYILVLLPPLKLGRFLMPFSKLQFIICALHLVIPFLGLLLASSSSVSIFDPFCCTLEGFR